jgi:hypothetical protein
VGAVNPCILATSSLPFSLEEDGALGFYSAEPRIAPLPLHSSHQIPERHQNKGHVIGYKRKLGTT